MSFYRSIVCAVLLCPTANAQLKVGAAITDITPPKLPVIVNGSMRSRSIDKINTRLHARTLAVSDGASTVVIVVADSCMMPRTLLDEAKALASKQAGIPTDHILISATHAHSAPSSMGALGTDADLDYVPFLKDRLAKSIAGAVVDMKPAKVGFGKGDAAEFTAPRRWIRRPDRIGLDPFGNKTVRATMHAARNPDDVTGESGPEDPELSLIAFQSLDGKPIAVLANFSMHYFTDRDISADYFGHFCNGLRDHIAPGSDFVGIMSHGCSGDIWRRDYMRPESWDPNQTIRQYANGLVDIAAKVYDEIEYESDAPVAMVERRMTLKYRVPNTQRLEWAKTVVAEMGNRLPKTQPEIYAREQIFLDEKQETEIVVQALRIGDIGIATTPNETYAITGLKIKAASPLQNTMVIELANGGDGYIPPPEQHLFGGYNTWAARSAGLEVQAEPKIAEACVSLLEQVTEKSRRGTSLSLGSAGRAILELKPVAWWRLDEFAGPYAADSSGSDHHAVYEPHVTYYLEGPHSDAFCNHETNRAAMFVGGRVHAKIGKLNDRYTICSWVWNGMPSDGREVTGWIWSRDHDNGMSRSGVHFGVAGAGGNAGRLILRQGDGASKPIVGHSRITRWKWHHAAVVRNGRRIRIYLDGKLDGEGLAGTADVAGSRDFFIGGRSDNVANWEGRLDEFVVFDRPLASEDIKKLATP